MSNLDAFFRDLDYESRDSDRSSHYQPPEGNAAAFAAQLEAEEAEKAKPRKADVPMVIVADTYSALGPIMRKYRAVKKKP